MERRVHKHQVKPWVVPRRGLHGNYPRFSNLCTVDHYFNEHHLAKTGSWCKERHIMYHWKGVQDSKATAIGDSLCKWVRRVTHTDLQAIPGLKLSRTLELLRRNILKIDSYKVIMILIGTNDVEECTPKEVVQKLELVCKYISLHNPRAKLAVSAILYRPRDNPKDMDIIKSRPRGAARRRLLHARARAVVNPVGNIMLATGPSTSSTHPSSATTPNQVPSSTNTAQPQKKVQPHPMEKRRRKVNVKIKDLCKKLNLYFLESWKITHKKKNGDIIYDRFADDGLHLSEDGVMALKKYIKGNIGTLLDAKK
jgi:lysophospholipase L1-like esterase